MEGRSACALVSGEILHHRTSGCPPGNDAIGSNPQFPRGRRGAGQAAPSELILETSFLNSRRARIFGVGARVASGHARHRLLILIVNRRPPAADVSAGFIGGTLPGPLRVVEPPVLIFLPLQVREFRGRVPTAG